MDLCCLYKRIENGHLQWPKDQDEVKEINVLRSCAGY